MGLNLCVIITRDSTRKTINLHVELVSDVIWFSKRQPMVETSVFGAEFVAMKNGMKTLRGVRYKL